MKAYDDNGRLLDASFDLESVPNGFDIILHSNGGVSRGKPPHNPDYIPALVTLLTRLAGLDAQLQDAWVDSKELAGVERARRRIQPGRSTYPIRLANIGDMGEFRLEIRRSVSRIGLSGDRVAGTGNKRIRISVSLPSALTMGELEAALIRPPSRYDPLKLRLSSDSAAVVIMNIDDVGELVGGLGEDAHRSDFWMPSEENRGRSVQEGAWRDAGYSAEFNQTKKEVTFRRTKSITPTKALALWNDAPPSAKHRVSRYVERGQIGAKVKAANGYRCQVCDSLGIAWTAFLKPDGIPYVEAHHVVPVATLAVDVLGPRNVISVCPNHHRQLHFGETTALDLGDEFEFRMPPHPTFRIRKFGG